MKKEGYQLKVYRHWIDSKDLIAFQVTVKAAQKSRESSPEVPPSDRKVHRAEPGF
jgi:hypothetical protein